MYKTLIKVKVFLGSIKEPRNIEQKISRLGIGIIIFQIISKFGVSIINPTILLFFETKVAFILMFLISLLIRYSLIIVYDKQKIDWFLIEELKQKHFEDKPFLSENKTRLLKIMNLIFINGGKIILVISLLIYDPFLLVIYQRKGSNKWNNIPNTTTLFLFIFSTIVCSLISLSWMKPVLNYIIK